MKLLNIVSPGNQSAIDDKKPLPNAMDELKTAKKAHKLKKGKYGITQAFGANPVSGNDAVDGGGDGSGE